MLKLGSTAFKIAAAGMMALSLAGCGAQQPYNPEAPAPTMATVPPAKSLEILTNQNVLPLHGDLGGSNGLYRLTLDGSAYGRDGDIPCAVILQNSGANFGWGSMSCDWEAAPRIASAAPTAAVTAAPVAAPSVAP